MRIRRQRDPQHGRQQLCPAAWGDHGAAKAASSGLMILSPIVVARPVYHPTPRFKHGQTLRSKTSASLNEKVTGPDKQYDALRYSEASNDGRHRKA
jgi:hypothetical protein